MRNAGYMLVAVGLAFAALLGTGCRKEAARNLAEKLVEKSLEQGGTTKKADVDLGTTDLSALPGMFRYPNAVGRGKVSGEESDGKFETWILESKDPVATVAAWYKAGLAAWKKGVTSEFGTAVSLNYESPDEKQAASVTIAPGKDGSVVTLMMKTKTK
jgi:hypothetical protein